VFVPGMISRLALLRLLAVAALCWASPALGSTVVVGGEEGYKPYESTDSDGQAVGFHVDLMRAIADEVAFEVRFELGAWETMRAGLLDGEIDVLGMFVSAQRAEEVDFAQPHVIVHHRIFIPADASGIRSLGDLTGKRVIVQRDAYSHEHLVQSGLDADLTLVDTDAEGLRLLAEGNHDAALLTEHRGRFTLRRGGFDRLTVSGPPVLPVEYAFAVRRGNLDMLEVLNQGLDAVMASGEFDRIYERWLQPYSEPRQTERSMTVLLASVAVIALLVLLVAGQMFRVWRLRVQRQEAEQQLNHLREHDGLTGLCNRPAFENEIDRFLRSASDDHDHALIMITIDRFRLVNENLGHAGGDRILVQVADCLNRILPPPALPARLDSDEFAALLPDTGVEAAIELGQQLLAEMGRIEPRPGMKLSASIGLVTFRGGDAQVIQLLRRADCAALAAKEDGGGRVHCWNDADRRLAERAGMLRWVGHIQSAMHEGRLTFHYQPIAWATGDLSEFYAVEMLVRMVDRDGEIIPACSFMPAAERYGLSPEIDRWMLNHVLSWLREHPEVPKYLERININISGRSLGDERFLEFLTSEIDRQGDLVTRLCFEITETALIANLDRARKVLDRLEKLGCRFALDDFGSGLSSMAYLRHLPVHYLKIDGGFVRDIEEDPAALKMVREINRLGHAVGKLTIAEFVETPRTRALLAESGVDLVQGYGIGSPAPVEQLLDWCRLQAGNDDQTATG
jgi:diguanylate cyclase (GGDEF)-like protein